MTRPTRRAGFTLIELLIVAAIFGTLFGMVVAMSRPSISPKVQVRQAAQAIASVLLQTQSRALGNPSGAGVILVPATDASSTSLAAVDMRPPIVGVCTSGMPPTDLAATSAAVEIMPTNEDPAALADGYKIRFEERPGQPATAWMAFASTGNVPPGPPPRAIAVVSFRTSGGQTTQNTIWPRPLPGQTLDVAVARYPSQGPKVLELLRNTAIDLRYSGSGDDPATTWGGLAAKGSIALSFDAFGGLDSLMQQVLTPAARTVQPLHPTSPVYLLVAKGEDVAADTALASQDSVWVAVDPQTGRIGVAPNVAQGAKDAPALRAAREKARALVAIGK
jgi:prepilin-type N-terminal cleavage/methylation domain-containing protein